MHVLVVDDDGDMRAVLEEEGYHVTGASDGHAALAHVWMTDTPLVVLLDQRLPGLTGTQVVEACLQAGTPTSPREFILLTASPQATPLNGRLPVIEKPFASETPLEAIARAAARLEGR